MFIYNKTVETKKSITYWNITWGWDRFIVGLDWNFQEQIKDVDILLGFLSIGFLTYPKKIKKPGNPPKKTA